jgi:hypothetical protein
MGSEDSTADPYAPVPRSWEIIGKTPPAYIYPFDIIGVSKVAIR